jgi:hydroxymethylpyrimidine/phosphomethylpyrimidine kinase
MNKRPIILTIAGHDPSGGAGLTADIKTAEALECYGLSVCSGNTIQNDIEMNACLWTDIEVMKSQITLLFNRFEINFIKVGIIENWLVLNELLDFILAINNKVKFILDPVLKSSSEYNFHDQEHLNTFEEILDKIYLITPNYPEIEALLGDKSIPEKIEFISKRTNLLLKGGHNIKQMGMDKLFETNGDNVVYQSSLEKVHQKHGSGCVLSSAIICFLALNYSLDNSCERGKIYIERFLNSNESQLGYHG